MNTLISNSEFPMSGGGRFGGRGAGIASQMKPTFSHVPHASGARAAVFSRVEILMREIRHQRDAWMPRW